ncbi:MAG: NifB/NifX family molybdenum-iron cluster-binding protein [Holdemania massiliensis]
MGEGAYQALKAQGITVVRGVSGKAETVLQNYAQGSLQDDPQAACSHHHDH